MLTQPAHAQWPTQTKKLIEYGWDVPTQDYVRKNIARMEQLPFDGIVFNLGDYRKAFDHEQKWARDQLQPHFEDLAHIQWNKFTDNFLFLRCSPTQMDWFDDRHWDNILHNINIFAEAVTVARCQGVCIDAEAYGKHSPWAYDWNTQTALHRDTKTYQQYAQQVRQRGSQFISALQSVMPNIKILTFFQLTIYDKLIADPNASLTDAAGLLAQHRYALYYHFINGMLDAAGPDVIAIDGNEHAYYYTTKSEYDKAHTDIRRRYQFLVDPDNRHKYDTQVQVGSALYVDHVFGTRMHHADAIGAFLTPADRPRLFQHNVYYALDTADEYVWCYSEKINWWRGKIPPGATDAITAAKTKLTAGQQLGFSIAPAIEAAKKQQQTLKASSLTPKTHNIGHLTDATPPPCIDGILDDPIWQTARPFDHLAPLLAAMKDKAIGPTVAWAAWDQTNLYVAFRCYEPDMPNMRTRGKQRDDNIWAADAVEVFISRTPDPKPFYHFIVNPHNIQWDAITDTKNNDTTWDAQWQSATHRTPDQWTVELAIPWQQISSAPKPGQTRRANITRFRRANHEWTTWTPLIDTFNSPENFGTWIFQGKEND